MVFVWSRLSRGDPLFTLSQVALNDSIMVVAFWLLMSDSFTLGQIVLGLVLGVVVPLFAARLDREFARIGTLRPLPKLLPGEPLLPASCWLPCEPVIVQPCCCA